MRVGELARRTGVGVSALRAWERRYGLLQPARSPAGHRLYDEADVERVNAVVRLVEDGLHLSVAVARVSAGGPRAQLAGEGEELLHGQVLDHADVGIWVARYGRTHYANPYLARLLGYDLDELLRLPVFDFFVPEDMELVRESTEKVRGGERNSVVLRLRKADGSAVVVRMDASPLPSPTGAYVGAIAVVSDHTEAEHRDRLLRLQSAVLDAVADATVIAGTDAAILHVNGAAERIFGRRLAEVVGRDGRQVLATAAADALADVHEVVVASGRYAGRMRIPRHDGSTFLTQTTAKLVEDEAGEPLGIVAVIHDQSDHDRARRDLRNREVQAEAVAVLGAQALRARTDPALAHAVMAEAIDAARRLVRAEEAAAFVHDHGGDLEVLLASPDPALGALGPVATAVAGFTRLARQPVHIRDTAADRRFEPDAPGSALGVPIEGPDGPIGALVVVAGAPDRVDVGGLHFLQSIANVVGGLVA